MSLAIYEIEPLPASPKIVRDEPGQKILAK